MTCEVARRYRFAGRHHVPGLPPPWSEPHGHQYVVEVVARAEDPAGLVVDTDLLDAAWGGVGPDARRVGIVDLDALYGAENTTVEALSARWLAAMAERVAEVASVTVWEDDERWGRATR